MTIVENLLHAHVKPGLFNVVFVSFAGEHAESFTGVERCG
jgi:hypothetical protein